jgi:ABC-2 type transport system permease protein
LTWTHLKTFLWLRWRLSRNHGKRLSKVNVAVDRLLTILAVVLACGSLVVFVLLGRRLADAPPVGVMMVWDAVVAGYLIFALIGLTIELQRSEMLSVERFLHLPVSPAGVFLVNYLGSTLRLGFGLFLPAMIGLSIGLLMTRGLAMAALVPLVLCFFVMMTAVLHQFRGWLASMMINRRRRQTILVIVTSVFLGVVMLPSLLTNNRAAQDAAERSERRTAERRDAIADGEMTPGQERFAERVSLINAVVPPGWLPHGASNIVAGDWLSVLAAMLGMGLIGALSLMRSYRTTLRLYKGDFTTGKRAARPVARELVANHGAARLTLTEWRLPLISEHASAIAVTCFRYLLRAPETKLMILSPVILVIVFGGTLARSTAEVSEHGRALGATGAAAVILLLTMMYFNGNQFAYDRDGFRSFMLSSASRRDVLLGKNLAFFPLALAFMLLGILTYHWFFPLRLDHVVAVLVQNISIYFLYCLAGNLSSVYAPVAIRPTSGMPLPGQGAKTILLTLMVIVFSIPLSLVLIPLGIEYAMYALDWHAWFPAFLVLSLVQAGVTLWLYLTLLRSQGDLLQRREQQILEVVTQKVD